MNQKKVNEISFGIIGAAIEIHKNLGPGLLEQVYESCLRYELQQRGFKINFQQPVEICYKGIMLDTRLRYDLLVEDSVIVELKAVEYLNPVFEAQVMTYMRLLEKPKGVLLNFCCTNIFREGQQTFVNEFYRRLPEK